MFLDEVRCQSSDKIGDPTILVNNAGVVKGKLLLDLTEEDITEYVLQYSSRCWQFKLSFQYFRREYPWSVLGAQRLPSRYAPSW